MTRSIDVVASAFRLWLTPRLPDVRPQAILEGDCKSLVDAIETAEALQRARDEIRSFRERNDSHWELRYLYVVRFVRPIVTEFLRRTEGRPESIGRLSDLLREYVNLLDQPEHPVQYRALIFGLAFQEPLRIGPHLVLRPMLSEELDDWQLGASPRLRDVLSMNPQVLAMDYAVPWLSDVSLHSSDGVPRRSVERAKLILSVLMGRRVYEPFTLQSTAIVPFHRSWRMAPEPAEDAFERSDSSGVQALLELLWNATCGPNSRVIDLAIRRYEMSLHRGSAADRLIDYWIILESIFSDSQSELAHKISLRVAAFLASGQAAVDSFRTLKKSYGLRSMVVHGAATSVDIERVEFTRQVARSAIIALARQERRFRPEAIDESFLAALPVPLSVKEET